MRATCKGIRKILKNKIIIYNKKYYAFINKKLSLYKKNNVRYIYTYEYIYIYIYVSIYIDILYEYKMVSGTVSTPVRSHMHTLILLQTNVILLL